MDRLLTFAGHRDPFVVADGEIVRDGPVLDVAQHRRFDAILVLSTPTTTTNAEDLKARLRERHSKLEVEHARLAIPDPIDYETILKALRQILSERLPRWGSDNIYVSVASGTPHMHAAWLLLVAGGELPARVLHTRPPQYVTQNKPAVEEVDFSNTVFPTVSAPAHSHTIPSPPADLNSALEKVGLVGSHPSLRETIRVAAQVADAAVPVLITGETGTGKELLAHLIHHLSGRPNDRFVTVNAATLDGDLVNSTLFGHEKGAFTGATNRRSGAFERADSGTLFLDELGELPADTQAKLLRTVQDGTFERLGGGEQLKTSTRLIAATNRNLKEAIDDGEFREDLYYRLNTIKLPLPPLRERRSDIPLLVRRFLDEMNEKYDRSVRVDSSTMDQLRQAPWPGNIRELRNALERAVLLAGDGTVDITKIQINKTDTEVQLPELHYGFNVIEYTRDVKDKLYEQALKKANNNQSEAGRLLGVSAASVSKYVRKRQSES